MKNIVKTPTETDERLIKKYLNGDAKSSGILYSRYYPKVYCKCLSFTKNTEDAFDLTQDILIKAFANLSSFKGNSKFSTWLFAITRNYCITNSLKAKNYAFENIESTFPAIDETPDVEELEKRKMKEDQELILELYLQNLAEQDKQLLELKYHNNFSIKELQNELGLSASAIKMRLMRARQKLGVMFVGE